MSTPKIFQWWNYFETTSKKERGDLIRIRGTSTRRIDVYRLRSNGSPKRSLSKCCKVANYQPHEGIVNITYFTSNKNIWTKIRNLKNSRYLVICPLVFEIGSLDYRLAWKIQISYSFCLEWYLYLHWLIQTIQPNLGWNSLGIIPRWN